MSEKCLGCRFFNNNPVSIERGFPGLNSLSSAYASVRAESGICSRLERFISSNYGCAYFESSRIISS